MKNNTTVTNANVNPANAIVKPAKTFWKEKVNAVRTDALMKSVGLDAGTVKAVYAQKPDGMELYTSYATTSVESIANNSKIQSMESVKVALDKFFSKVAMFELLPTFAVSYGTHQTTGLQYVRINPVTVTVEKVDLSKEELVKRLSVILSSFATFVYELSTLSDNAISELYAYSQANVSKSEQSEEFLFGIQDNLDVMKWGIGINFDKVYNKLNDKSDNS